MGSLYGVDGTTGNIVTSGSIIASGPITSNSITSGFLPPRLTTTQRNAIVSPSTGLEIFNTTTNQPEFYNGIAWVGMITISPAGSNTQIQFNNSGIFGASSNLTWDNTNEEFVIRGTNVDHWPSYNLEIQSGTTGFDGYVDFNEPGFGTSASNVGSARIYFDNTLHHLRLSENGGSFADIVLDSGNYTIAGTWIFSTAPTLSTALSVTSGGTGSTSLTAHNVLLGEGTSALGLVAPSTSGGMLLSQGTSADPAFESMSGDATLAGTGALILATVNTNTGSFGSSTAIPNFTVNGKGLITAAGTNVVVAPAGTLSGTTLNSTVVSSSLTSVGTITSGIWTGTTISVANGGTGDTSLTAYAVLAGGTTSTGSIQSVSGVGTTGQVLTSNGASALPTWQPSAGSGTVNTGTATHLSYYATSTNAVSDAASATISGAYTFSGGVGAITMSGSTIAMGSNKITGIATPTTSGDALSYGNILNGTTLTLSSTVNSNISFDSTSTHGIVGTTTNDNAATGNVGEYISSSVAGYSATTSGQWSDATSISLTAGDWDISVTCDLDTNQVALVTQQLTGISSTAGNSGAGMTSAGGNLHQAIYTTSSTMNFFPVAFANYRVQPTTTTTYYFKFLAVYSGTAPQVDGIICARRRR